MKKTLVFILSILMVLSMTACSSGGGGGGSSGTVNQGQTNTPTVSLKDASMDNYKEVVKEAFGIELYLPDKFEVANVNSPNGVNNLDIIMTYPSDYEGKEILEAYFNECKDLGVYKQNINWDTLAISKGTQYTDFETMYAAEVTSIMNFYSVMWLYDYNNKNVQFSLTLDEGLMEINFTYATLNYEINMDDWVPQDGQGPEGWVWQEDHGWITGVWDSEVLPENFPKEIPGVRVEDTTYWSYGAERWMGTSVGDLYFEDYNFEEWELTFDATKEQLEQFQQALLDNGFLGSKDEDYNKTYYEVTDGYVYLHYVVYESDREGYDHNVFCDMTVVEREHPVEFEGFKLPTFGLFDHEDPNDAQVYAYDADFNEIYDYEYDFAKGQSIGEMPPWILYWFGYSGVSREEYNAYIDDLRAMNLEEWDEYHYYDEEDYVVVFKYGNHYYGCYFNFDGVENGVDFVISSDSESRFY
ncbi:MAG: hypothetical protein IKL88_03175 [Erysipelotrichales bacterium]|nr:hypothetical protein [Erysipelotrichales bacterium]